MSSTIKILQGITNLEKHFESFNQLYGMTLNGDYQHWFTQGYCGESYIPIFIVERHQVIANVSIVPMTLILTDRYYKALQINTIIAKKNIKINY